MSNKERFRRNIQETQTYITDPAGPVEFGDLTRWNAAAGGATRLAAAGNAAEFLGVAEGSVPVTSNIDNVVGLEDLLTVRHEGVFEFKTSAADAAIIHGDKLTIGADNQTVLKTAIDAEVVAFANIPRSLVVVVGGPGVEIEIEIRRNFPNADLA